MGLGSAGTGCTRAPVRLGGRLGLLAAGVLLAAACGRTPDPASTESGLTRIEALPELVLTEELRVGSVDDPDRGFSFPTAAEVADDGTIFVMDSQEREIRVVSSQGEVLRSIGGPGEGPGEFQGSPRFGLHGDTVWAVEVFEGRITLFDREGSLLQASAMDRFRVPLPGAYGVLTPWLMRPDGSFLGWFGLIMSSRGEDTGVVEDQAFAWPAVRFDVQGEIVDTLGWVPRPPPSMWRPSDEEVAPLRFVEVAGARHVVPAPPSGLADWEPALDGYVIATAPPATDGGGVITVTRVAWAGDTLSTHELGYAPESWSSEELDSIAARAARGTPGGFAPYRPGASAPENWRQVAARLRTEMDFPEYKHPLAYTWVGSHGHVVLALRSSSEEDRAAYVLMSPSGEPMGRFALAPTARLLWTDGRALLTSESDAVGVPWVVRYRLQ